MFPEVEELCLGYAGQSTKGSGSGRGFSKVITEALWEAIEAGITEITHFEEVGILRSGIGADRISDITANILRRRFINHTLEICRRHDVPTSPQKVIRGIYNDQFQRWMPLDFELPVNPYNGQAVLLCPAQYLRELPTISAENFWDYCYDNENETLRNDYGLDITRNVDKETIVEFARKHPDIRREFIDHVEDEEPIPYDYLNDRKGLVTWYEATEEYCRNHPAKMAFSSEEEFVGFINGMLDIFRNYVENNGGWGLLWNDNGTSRSEEAAQRLFLGIVMHYCRANDIDISKEVNIGRGPVDFKVSRGYEYRALIELKLARNTKFWSGLQTQLPKYQQAENIKIGYFVIILYTEKDDDRLKDIQKRVRNVNKATGYSITSYTIDAQRSPPSASNL